MEHTDCHPLSDLIAVLATLNKTVAVSPELLERAMTGKLAVTTWEADGLIHFKASDNPAGGF